jgi:hypothetical protein
MKRRKHAIVQTRSKGLMAIENKPTPEGATPTGVLVQIWVETEPQKENENKDNDYKAYRPKPTQGHCYR